MHCFWQCVCGVCGLCVVWLMCVHVCMNICGMCGLYVWYVFVHGCASVCMSVYVCVCDMCVWYVWFLCMGYVFACICVVCACVVYVCVYVCTLAHRKKLEKDVGYPLSLCLIPLKQSQ